MDSLEVSAATSGIAVIGVTDYMSIDGYEKLLSAYGDNAKPRLQSVKLLVPNIEFRALPSTKDGKALNIHLLVDPSDSQHIQKIKRALKNLKVSYNQLRYGCIREELIEFARAQDAALNDDDVAYRRGIEQFKPSYEVILNWFRDEGWLRANCLIGISNGKDGISGLPLDGFAAMREEILKNCDFVFSGNPSDRLHYLGQKENLCPEKIEQLYGSLKPCLHGSDAHEVSKLFKPNDDRFCWIKADPTFEGLRQVLWEPEARVQISSTKPQLSDASRVIASLQISKSNGWFTQSSISFNSGLVAIIGEKGSGKTAIADLVAFASGIAMDPNSQSSFVTKGRLHLSGTTVELGWGAGAKTCGVLTDHPYPSQRPLVRYLSQDFVERLCSDDHHGNELQVAIEEVVFSHLGEIHKEGFSSFEELRSSREAASQSRQDEFRGQLATLNREIERLYGSLGQRSSKEALKTQTQAQIGELKKQLPSVQGLADQAVLKQLEAEQGALNACEKVIAEKTRQRRGVEDFQKSYVAIKERTERQITELIDSHPEATFIFDSMLAKLLPQWDMSAAHDLSAGVVALDAEISALRGDEAKVATDGKSLVEIARRIKGLQELLSKDELNRKRLLDLQKQISMQEATAQRLAKEIDDLDVKVTKLLRQREHEREELYLKFFSALAEDEQGLQDLYAPMKQALSSLGEEMKFELSAGYRVDTSDWLEKAQRFYDGRKPQALAKKDEIEKFVLNTLAPAWKSGDIQKIDPALKHFVSIVSPVDFMSKFASPSPKMIDLFDWMFSTDHIGTTYKIKYGGTELEFLSPGTRGIALLVLYLLMDEDDRRPLVIDQPEGNLDNSSIYLQLVPYIRKAKEKRQIILVTHNPNLVVATDAEQVIVATAQRPSIQAFPCITYISGSLENSHDGEKDGIRQAVCTLLEGGERAFKEREGRYSIRS
ncbi:hypothetical protein EUB48_20625 [Rhodoferax sediminis]|uniref:Uncharacterized protein n=1 Tax=Rhodoferax sediminis TaxID=2509614 RepID=A0A515DHN7_9BURK|nr:hypothetical protein EUB48_20625 [Rhodoferax sediminis]